MPKAEILIVEDDLVTATVIMKYLQRNDYKVMSIVSNGETAIDFVKESRPDLILMDIMLKDSIDGIETASRINELYDIPVIYLTADSSPETIERAKITEPFGYLVKPVESSVLITNIELTLQKQLAYNKKILETLKKANDELEKRVLERTEELSHANLSLKKEMEQRVIAEKELKKAESLATIGKMSAILAHEIRNPLNSIKINADILFEIPGLAENNVKRLKIIKKEVSRLDNLVREVLMFSRQQDLIITEVDLHKLVDSISSQMKHYFEGKNIIFQNLVDIIYIKADLEKIKQVFLNLVINSSDSIYDGGEIIIEAKKNKKGKCAEIYVKDNGCGISAPERIFEPFYTTKSSGSGLGLSISQNIITQHNGSLDLLSSKHGETIFLIKLPLK